MYYTCCACIYRLATRRELREKTNECDGSYLGARFNLLEVMCRQETIEWDVLDIVPNCLPNLYVFVLVKPNFVLVWLLNQLSEIVGMLKLLDVWINVMPSRSANQPLVGSCIRIYAGPLNPASRLIFICNKSVASEEQTWAERTRPRNVWTTQRSNVEEISFIKGRTYGWFLGVSQFVIVDVTFRTWTFRFNLS